MKTHNLIILIFGMLMFASTVSVAQVEYHEYDTTDDILIEYRWQRGSFLGRNPDAILNLKMTNLSDETLEVVFTAGFYKDHQLFFESEEQRICLASGESQRGGRAGLRFKAENIKMDTIEEEWFSWDIPFIEVTPVVHCE